MPLMISQMNSIKISASVSGYIILVGFWLLLALAYFWLTIEKPESGSESGLIIAGLAALFWLVWLKGFVIQIEDGELIYRDGFFRRLVIRLEDITQADVKWVDWLVIGRVIKLPRLVVSSKKMDREIFINIKPFSRKDINKVVELLKARRGEISA